MLDIEINYYQKNKHKFRELYLGKYIVIKDKAIISVHDSHEDAYQSAVATHEVGTFIIKHIVKRGVGKQGTSM